MNLLQVIGIIKEHGIIRRYMVTNSFDGALTMFGIIIASYIAGIQNPALITLPSIGVAIALCVSGIWSAYAAESAEVKKKIKYLEKHMLTKLHASKRYAESRKITMLVGLVNGLSPLITAFIILIPFFLSKIGILGMAHAYYLSSVIIALILFLLGAFLGRIAKENIFKSGLKMIFAGISIAVIFYILSVLNLI